MLQNHEKHKNSTQSGSISHLIIPDRDTTIRIQDQNEMNNRLWLRNKDHFKQAKGTPCTIAPLINLLGFGRNTYWSDQIINGEAKYQDISDRYIHHQNPPRM